MDCSSQFWVDIKRWVPVLILTQSVTVSMMLLLLTGALVVGLAASQSNPMISYQVGKEYKYEYEGQVLTGLPRGSRIYSGTKVKCNAILQYKLSLSQVTMKLTNIHLYKRNGPVFEEYDPTSQMLPDKLFEEMTNSDMDIFVTELSRPVDFNYIRGHVSDIKTEKDDPYWSVNFKKGFLSLLEINFNERHSFEVQASIRSNSYSSDGTEKKFYRVMEESVVGECETTYMLDPAKSINENEGLFMTKVRNYNNCLMRPYYLHSIFDYDNCYECPEKKFDPMSSQSQVHYSIQGTSHQFLILGAVGESVHSFTAYNELGGSFVTFINQTMVFSDMMNIEEQISNIQSPKTHECGLVADMPEIKKQSWNPSSLVPDDSDLIEGYPYFDQRFVCEKVKELMKVYKEFTDKEVKEEAAVVYMELKRLLKIASRQTLVDLVNEFGSESFEQYTLHNILPYVGTYASVDILINSVLKEAIKPELAEFVLSVLGLYADPHVLTIKRVLDLLTGMTSWPTSMMKRTAWLNLGTMSHKMTKAMMDARKKLKEQLVLVQTILEQETRKNSREAFQSRQHKIEEKIHQAEQIYGKIKNEIVQTILILLHSGDRADKILALKTIGNAGFEDFIPELKKVVEDKTQPYTARLTAAYAFRRIIQYAKAEVKKIFMQRYFDNEDLDEIRMAGLQLIFKTEPTPSELELIAQSLWHETSENVGSFAYSILEELSNSTHPCESTLARNATIALRLAKRFEPSQFFSSFMQVHTYYSLWRVGSTMHSTIFYNPSEVSPRAAFFGFSLELLSHSNPMLEIGYVAKGLDSIMRAFMGPDSRSVQQPPTHFKTDRVLQDSSHHISSIKQKMKVSPREYEKYEGNILIKFFGNEIGYYELEEIWQLISSQGLVSWTKSTLNRILKYNRIFSFADHHKAILSEIGFPLRLIMDGFLVSKVTGNIETENVETSASQRAMRWNALVNLRKSGAKEMHWKMTCDAAIFMNGAVVKTKTHLDLPLKLKTDLDFSKRKFIVKADFPMEKQTLVSVESKPSTFFTVVSRKSSRYPYTCHECHPDIKEITVVEGAFLVPFNKEYGAYIFGHRLNITGTQVLTENQRGVVFFPFSGKQSFTLIHTPGLDPAPSYVLQFQYVIMPLGPKVHTEKQQRSKSGIWSWISPLFESEETQKRPTYDGSQTSANFKFIDIENEDMTLQRIIDFFGTRVKPLSSSITSGFVLRLAENTLDPKRQFQIVTLWQRDQGNRIHFFNTEVRRTPCPSYETEHWVKDTHVKLLFPRMEAKPSDLFVPAYHEEIQKKIHASIYSNGKVDHIWDLKGAISAQEAMFMKMMAQYMISDNIIESVMEHVIEHCTSPQMQELRMVIYQLRKISTEVRKVQQQTKDLAKSQSIVTKIRSIIEMVRKIQDVLSRHVQTGVTASDHQIDEAPTIHYAILKHHKITADLKEVARRIQAVAPQDIKKEIQSAVQQQEQVGKDIRQSYEQAVTSRHNLERQRIQTHLSHDYHSLYRSLQDIEIQMNDLASKLRQHKEQIAKSVSSSSSPSAIEAASTQVEQIVQCGKRLKEQVDKAMEKSALEKMLRVKVFEVVLQQEEAVQGIADIIVSYHKIQKPSYSGYNPIRLSCQMEQMKQQSKWLAMHVGVSVSHEQELMSIAWFASSKDNDTLRELQAAEILQIRALENLESSNDRCKPGQEEEPTSQMVQMAAAVSEEAWSKIKKVVQDMEFESNWKRQVIKTYRILARQVVLAAEVKRAATEKFFCRTAKESSDAKVAEQIKKTADHIIQEVTAMQVQVASVIEGASPRSSARSVQSYESLLSESKGTAWRRKQWHAELQDEPKESQSFSSIDEDTEPVPDELFCLLKGVYGPESQMNSQYSMKIMGRKSLEQLMWEEDQWSPLKQDPLVRQYLSEKQDGQEQATPSYQSIWKELNTLRHMHIVFTYEKENVDEILRYASWMYQEYMKAQWYHHVSFVFPDASSKENMVEFTSEFRRNNRQLDMNLRTPYETDIFRGLNIPPAVTHWLNSIYPTSILETIIFAMTNEGSRHGRCTVNAESVYTFDGAVISIPMEQSSSCETVLAMDCSDHSSFLVSSKPNPQDPKSRHITIRTMHTHVETTAQSGKAIVNGQEIILQDGETHRAGSADEEVRLERNMEGMVISVPVLDLVVVTDGQQTIIEVSKWLKSRTCGICGNNDGQKSNEGQDPQQRQCSHDAALSASYLIPDDSCNAHQLQTHARVEEFCRSSDECSPLYQNKVLEQEISGEQKVCFSIEPVKKCPSPCKATGSISYHKGIHCLDTRSPQARKLKQDSKFRPLDELKHKTVSQYIYIDEPTSCVRDTVK
ncbi:hypothetical protein CHS0354_042208 [Potamilus streckersoni]|uniref:Vitellogenin n=1 Tax=Potamilus streckersoni TaxID=2493646 RepID=A0AAE0TLH5_9BIVA|nr:hypothetical protein CHS0354_042208 [Potamilus streckersoni]